MAIRENINKTRKTPNLFPKRSLTALDPIAVPIPSPTRFNDRSILPTNHNYMPPQKFLIYSRLISISIFSKTRTVTMQIITRERVEI